MPSDALSKVQEEILLLIKEAPKPELVDGHGLQKLYGDKFKRKLELGAFGCTSLKELIDKCDKLAPKIKHDKMYIRIKGAAVESKPAAAAAAAADGATTSVREAKREAKRRRDGADAPPVVKSKGKVKKLKSAEA